MLEYYDLDNVSSIVLFDIDVYMYYRGYRLGYNDRLRERFYKRYKESFVIGYKFRESSGSGVFKLQILGRLRSSFVNNLEVLYNFSYFVRSSFVNVGMRNSFIN